MAEETTTIQSGANICILGETVHIPSNAQITGYAVVLSDTDIWPNLKSDAVVWPGLTSGAEIYANIRSIAEIIPYLHSDAVVYQPTKVPETIFNVERVRSLTPADISTGIRIF